MIVQTDALKLFFDWLIEFKLLWVFEIMTLMAPPLSEAFIYNSDLVSSLSQLAGFIQVSFVFNMQTLNATQALCLPVIIIHLSSSTKRNIKKAHI